jgi:DNA-binding XRE family transcriptional regulator
MLGLGMMRTIRAGDGMEQIALRFIEFRQRNFMTQQELGEFIGLSRPSISLIEKRKQLPHYKTLRRFNLLVQQEKRGRGKFIPLKSDRRQSTKTE